MIHARVRLAAVALPIALLATAGCDITTRGADERPVSARDFPSPDRPVAAVVSNQFSDEDSRDDRNEAEVVMDLANIREGMTVADIGAGEGYYTTRLAERVGRRGRVLGQDIDSAVLERLGSRVQRERLDNVSIKRGAPDDPMLPEKSFDRIMLVHMYHEVTEPYAFLWRLRPALKPGGQVIVVDLDRPTGEHGMPPALLFCEFEAVGFRLAAFIRRPELAGYYARFEAEGPRPDPQDIVACKQDAITNTAETETDTTIRAVSARQTGTTTT